MGPIINQFEELTTAKKIKRARIFISNGEVGVKVWYDNKNKTYIFELDTEVEQFMQDLYDIGVECKLLK